jgi:hypothetical protein
MVPDSLYIAPLAGMTPEDISGTTAWQKGYPLDFAGQAPLALHEPRRLEFRVYAARTI